MGTTLELEEEGTTVNADDEARAAADPPPGWREKSRTLVSAWQSAALCGAASVLYIPPQPRRKRALK